MRHSVKAEDIFETAIGLEEAGNTFYKGWAELSARAEVRTLCLSIAGDENAHIAVLARVVPCVKAFIPAESYQGECEGQLMMVSADLMFDTAPMLEMIRKKADASTLVKIAAEFERRSVLLLGEFAHGKSGQFISPDARAAAASILEDERAHLGKLTRLKAEMKL